MTVGTIESSKARRNRRLFVILEPGAQASTMLGYVQRIVPPPTSSQVTPDKTLIEVELEGEQEKDLNDILARLRALPGVSHATVSQ